MKVLQNSFGQCIEFHCILLYFRSSDDMKVLQNVVGFGECWTLYSICIVFHCIVLQGQQQYEGAAELRGAGRVGQRGRAWLSVGEGTGTELLLPSLPAHLLGPVSLPLNSLLPSSSLPLSWD